jgi:hypothetical protein
MNATPDPFVAVAALAAEQHGLFHLHQARDIGATDRMRGWWLSTGRVERLAPNVYRMRGAPPTWRQDLLAATFTLGRPAFAAGRSGARLLALDGFVDGPVDVLGVRARRSRPGLLTARAVFTGRPVLPGDRCVVDGIPTLRAERLILDAGLFGCSRREVEKMIDSAIRLRLTTEERLRARFDADPTWNARGRAILRRALVDAGGESTLERRFLQMIRLAGLPRPVLQRVYRADGRTIARVDAEFPGGLVVELAGHATHSSRQQRQSDAQRHTELTLRGKRVLTFTFDDQRDRPHWVIARLHDAGVAAVA